MACDHFCYSSLKAFSVSLFLYLLLHVSSNVAVEFSMDLNHRDSPLHNPASINRDSPLQDPAAVNHSTNSHNFNSTFHTMSYHMNVKLIESFFVVRNIIGKQSKYFDAIISTASNLNWVLCFPCRECHFTYDSIFSPRVSTSYRKLNYTSAKCSSLLMPIIDIGGKCWFKYTYADDTWIDGVLSEDKFLLLSKKKNLVLDDFTFGCIHTTGGSFSKAAIGFMGLGRSSYSFAAQMGRKLGSMKFSYCLPISPTAVGWLRFGSAAGVSGPEVVTTPLVDDNSNLYKARLKSIIVQGFESDPIDINQKDNLIVIDSATQASYIHPDALHKLINQVTHCIGVIPQRRALENYLCYDISKVDKPNLPWITFIFHGNGEIYLNQLNAFTMRSEEEVCLAFRSNKLSHGVSIFGNLAQMGRHIQIDPVGNTLSMLGGQCNQGPTPLV